MSGVYRNGLLKALLIDMSALCLQERKLTLSTLLLLCDAAKANITSNCFVAMRKMSHVTMLQALKAKQSDGETDVSVLALGIWQS